MYIKSLSQEHGVIHATIDEIRENKDRGCSGCVAHPRLPYGGRDGRVHNAGWEDY
ncbi:MAG: hypothetical protein WDN75_09735 [Bacteroidota bacterium]